MSKLELHCVAQVCHWLVSVRGWERIWTYLQQVRPLSNDKFWVRWVVLTCAAAIQLRIEHFGKRPNNDLHSSSLIVNCKTSNLKFSVEKPMADVARSDGRYILKEWLGLGSYGRSSMVVKYLQLDENFACQPQFTMLKTSLQSNWLQSNLSVPTPTDQYLNQLTWKMNIGLLLDLGAGLDYLSLSGSVEKAPTKPWLLIILVLPWTS